MSLDKDQYLSTVWKKVLAYLQVNTNISPTTIKSFYEPSSLKELTDTKAIIVVESIIYKQILQKDSESIATAFIDILNLDHNFSVEICNENEFSSVKNKKEVSMASMDMSEFASMPIQKDHTFSNFIVGDCNKESHAAALACAAQPGQFFNPLFIYGNSGLGKTHLLMAIANYVMDTFPEKKVYYTESLKFVENVVKAIHEGKIEQFKQYLYSVDVLIIDDIQFIAGKEKSHEIFFTIYNELINNRKQVCIASDRQPNEIKGLEDRLISRFSSGLSVGIDSPEFETSLAILQLKIKQNGYGIEDVDSEGLAYIASNFSGNVRNLEGAWNRVLFYAIQFQPDGGIIRFETVMNALRNQATVSETTGLSPKKIINTVADYYGLTHQQITSKTRTKNISNARQISIYLCRKLLNLSYIKIGDAFGGRDHSTVINAYEKISKALKKDEALNTAIHEIEQSLK